MSEEPAPQRRLQLHLADLVFVAVLCGTVCLAQRLIVVILGVRAIPDIVLPEVEMPVEVYGAGIAVTFFSAIVILALGIRWSWGRIQRMVFCGVIAGSLGFAVGEYHVVYHRISDNQNRTVQACKKYCTAQDIYRRIDNNGDGVLEYASTARGPEGLGNSGIEKAFTEAFWGEGTPAVPKDGYVFKILTAQGTNAPGGERSFVSKGHVSLGYALVASPAVYGLTGKMTFLVSNAGTIYQFDYGEKTPAVFQQMIEYDPPPVFLVNEGGR